MSDHFSPFVLNGLADVITGGSYEDAGEPIGVYRSGPKIAAFFLDCGCDMRIRSSSRVPATFDFLRDLTARPDADESLKRIVLRACNPRDYLSAR